MSYVQAGTGVLLPSFLPGTCLPRSHGSVSTANPGVLPHQENWGEQNPERVQQNSNPKHPNTANLTQKATALSGRGYSLIVELSPSCHWEVRIIVFFRMKSAIFIRSHTSRTGALSKTAEMLSLATSQGTVPCTLAQGYQQTIGKRPLD